MAGSKEQQNSVDTDDEKAVYHWEQAAIGGPYFLCGDDKCCSNVNYLLLLLLPKKAEIMSNPQP